MLTAVVPLVERLNRPQATDQTLHDELIARHEYHEQSDIDRFNSITSNTINDFHRTLVSLLGRISLTKALTSIFVIYHLDRITLAYRLFSLIDSSFRVCF